MFVRLFVFALLLSGSYCRGPKALNDTGVESLAWKRARVKAHVQQIALAPHPMGSPRQEEVVNYLQGEAEKIGLKVTRDSFTADVPNPDVLKEGASPMLEPILKLNLINLYAKLEAPGTDCVLLLGSHSDSKRLEDGPSLGANDSASSSAVLLELMQNLKELSLRKSFRCSVLAVWFDGEEAYLPEWRDGEGRHPAKIVDHLYGSRRLAGRLRACGEDRCLPQDLGGESVQVVIVLDMLGLPMLQLSPDFNSDQALLGSAKKWDQKLFKGALYGQSLPKSIEDDHLPFRELKIPVLDLIGFENTLHWHTIDDTPDKLSDESMERGGQLAGALVQDILKVD